MLGLGCMRLSTEANRDDASSLAVLEAALDAGIDLLDTSDAYAHDEHDIGHNERLIARAIAGRRVTVVTKGGLERPGGAWVPNGRARHLDAARPCDRRRRSRVRSRRRARCCTSSIDTWADTSAKTVRLTRA